MILDEHFDRILVISLPGAEERSDRALKELREKRLSETAAVFRAVDGKLCPPTDWWPSGSGAWGCMQSHYRAVQDALLDGVERLLVIEDDCIWQNDAAALAREFLGQVPDDWGQIYFGGQHRTTRRPEWIKGKPAVLRARSVHRTHCYAIKRETMPSFLKHVLYAPDYIEALRDPKQPHKRHIDHQLEIAHRRGDWPVYCPSFWLAGQGENHSHINGKKWPAAWWHISWREQHRRLPIIICDREPSEAEAKWMHFGRHVLEGEPRVDAGVRDSSDAADLTGIFDKIASEAYGGQRLPAMDGRWPEKTEWLRGKWNGPVILLSADPDLEALCDYPASKLTFHDWINPRSARQAEVREGDETESTEVTAAAEGVPTVHQVWIGPDEMPPRLAGYCETIRAAFPGWNYKLWREEDMEALAERAVLPRFVLDRGMNIALRSDVVRLEILRQQGGVYFDVDFEALKDDLRPLFADPLAFYYGDEDQGRPSNACLAALQPGHAFIDLYLRRIAAGYQPIKGKWDVVKLSGPEKLAECLNFWVGDWDKNEPHVLDGVRVGSHYGQGTITGFWRETLYPYHFREGTWASFDAKEFPAAWAAHHWEGSWTRD